MGAHSTELARAMEIHMISIPQSVLMNLLSRVLRLSLNIYQSEHPPTRLVLSAELLRFVALTLLLGHSKL